MKEKSLKVTNTLYQISEVYKIDWNEQIRKGQRKELPSKATLSEQFSIAFPTHPPSFLKKVYIYENAEKPMSIDALVDFIEFLFVHNYTPHGWPEVRKVVEKEFSYLLKRYEGTNLYARFLHHELEKVNERKKELVGELAELA